MMNQERGGDALSQQPLFAHLEGLTQAAKLPDGPALPFHLQLGFLKIRKKYPKVPDRTPCEEYFPSVMDYFLEFFY